MEMKVKMVILIVKISLSEALSIRKRYKHVTFISVITVPSFDR